MNRVYKSLAVLLAAFAIIPTTARGEPILPEGAILQFGRMPFQNGSPIHTSALSPDGKLLATYGGRSITVYDTSTGMPRHRFFLESPERIDFEQLRDDERKPVLAFSPDSRRLACKLNCRLIVIWDLPRNKEARRITAEENALKSSFLRFSADARALIVPFHFAPRWIDVDTGKVTHELPDIAIENLSADDRLFLSYSNGRNEMIIGKTSTGATKQTIELDAIENGGNEDWLFLPDGKTLAALHRFEAESNYTTRVQVQFWDLASGKRLPQVWKLSERDDKKEAHLTLSPDGDTLMFRENPRSIRRFQWRTGKEDRPFDFGLTCDGTFHPHPESKTLFCAHGAEIRRWNLDSGKQISKNDDFACWNNTAISPDGRHVALGSDEKPLELWDTSTGKRVKRWESPAWTGRALAFAPDGRSLAINCYYDVRFLGVPDLAEIGKLQPARALAPESARIQLGGGRYVAALDAMGRLRAFDAATNKVMLLAEHCGHFRVTPNGQAVVAVRGHTVCKYALADGELQFTRALPNDDDESRRWGGADVTAMAFTRDGRTLALALSGGQICLLDGQSGEQRSRFLSMPEDDGHEIGSAGKHFDHATTLAFSPDGRWLTAECTDGYTRIWETSSRREVHRFLGQDAVQHLVFSQNGRRLISVGLYECFVWDIRPKRSSQKPNNPFEELLSNDAPIAYRAQWSLIDDPKGPALLREKLPRQSDVSPERIARLIADLDSEDFTTRDAATRALEQLEGAVRPALKAALARNPSAEVELRLKHVLARLDAELTPPQLRVERAVQAMEICGSDEARKVLTEWADGTPGIRLTDRAREALGRLEKRKPQ